MKSIVAALLLLLGSPIWQFSEAQHQSHCALPSPKLLTCKSADCSLLLPEKPESSAVYPKQVIIDMNKDCAYGLTALYDKSVPIDEVKAAIDERYKQWGINIPPNSPPYVWRVEPERFAIQLSTASKQDEKKTLIEAGTSRVIYIAFGGEAACAGGAPARN